MPWPRTWVSASRRILYYFNSKEALLDAVIDEAGDEMIASLERALAGPAQGWDRVDAVVRSVFRLAARRPELLGLLREVSRLGPPAATRFTAILGPFIERATGFLEEGMDAGMLRQQDARLLLLTSYSTVVGSGNRGGGSQGPRRGADPPGVAAAQGRTARLPQGSPTPARIRRGADPAWPRPTRTWGLRPGPSATFRVGRQPAHVEGQPARLARCSRRRRFSSYMAPSARARRAAAVSSPRPISTPTLALTE